MRKPRNRDIYAGASMGSLQAAQVRALLPTLQRCAGSHGLLLSAGRGEPPPALPLLSHWAQLQVDGKRYRGDLVGATDEPLAFVDDAFDLVWLRHALEVVDDFAEVLQEAIRILVPGGTLVISGVHPFSAWAPWYYWQERGAGHGLHAPSRLAFRLRRSGMDTIGMRRVGCAWPRASDCPARLRLPAGGGYVLVAQKQRTLVTPLRLRAAPLPVPANGRLSPSARRRLTA